MAYGYNTSANQTRNNSYSYSPEQAPKDHIADGQEVFNYSEVYSNMDTNSSASKTKNKNAKASSVGVWGITMGQTQNFTFAIAGLNNADASFTLNNRSGMFLPLKNMTFKPVTLDHLKIKAGVFSDLPFFHRRRMGTISCVMHDSHRSLLSNNLIKWYNGCVCTQGFVPYIDDMCRDAEYIEYTYDGKIAVKYKFSVIPDGDVSTSRAYEGDGALTEYNFSLIIVSDIKMCQNGKWVEADWGDGYGEDADYERRVSWKIQNQEGLPNMSFTDPAIQDQLR